MADTCQTIQSAVEILIQAGAKKVYAIVTHGEVSSKLLSEGCTSADRLPNLPGVLSDGALDALQFMPLEKLVVSLDKYDK